jgi:hypothetical protein
MPVQHHVSGFHTGSNTVSLLEWPVVLLFPLELQVPMFAGVPLGETVEPPLRRDDDQALPSGTRCSYFCSSMLCYICSVLKVILVGSF